MRAVLGALAKHPRADQVNSPSLMQLASTVIWQDKPGEAKTAWIDSFVEGLAQSGQSELCLNAFTLFLLERVRAQVDPDQMSIFGQVVQHIRETGGATTPLPDGLLDLALGHPGPGRTPMQCVWRACTREQPESAYEMFLGVVEVVSEAAKEKARLTFEADSKTLAGAFANLPNVKKQAEKAFFVLCRARLLALATGNEA